MYGRNANRFQIEPDTKEVAMTKRKVLIPLDDSAYSRQIIGQVQKFLPAEGHELVLLRVSEAPKGLTGRPLRIISPDGYVTGYENASDLEFSEHPVYASQKMEAAIAALTDELQPDRQLLESGGYLVRTAVKFGDPARAIVAYATDEAIDLIAMTTHGRSGLRRLVAGSVAAYVMRHAPVPVLLLRPDELPREQQEYREAMAAE
jgi:nucleotide-binding universal stress UspA family protein